LLGNIPDSKYWRRESLLVASISMFHILIEICANGL
jgi:hypothetical protein